MSKSPFVTAKQYNQLRSRKNQIIRQLIILLKETDNYLTHSALCEIAGTGKFCTCLTSRIKDQIAEITKELSRDKPKSGADDEPKSGGDEENGEESEEASS